MLNSIYGETFRPEPEIACDLFQFAYIPAWFDQLERLAQTAADEPWDYKHGAGSDRIILERYLKNIFRKQAIDYGYAQSRDEADDIFYVRNEFACFHTGLYTAQYKDIYMCFERNKRKDSLLRWYLKGFAQPDSTLLKYVQPLPSRPFFPARQYATYFDPEWSIRINASHILTDPENVSRLPESIRDAWNLPLLLETAAELARRKALLDWNLAVPQVFQGKVQYLLPIHLTNMATPDLALALSVMEGYYIGHTCLTLEMAYQNARLLTRPTARWLREIVEDTAAPEPPTNLM